MYKMELRSDYRNNEIINLLNLFKIRDSRFIFNKNGGMVDKSDMDYLKWSLKNNYIEMSFKDSNKSDINVKLYISLDYSVIGLDKLFINQNKNILYYTQHKYSTIHTSPINNELYGVMYLSDKYFTRLYNYSNMFNYKSDYNGLFKLVEILNTSIDKDEYDYNNFYTTSTPFANLSSILKMGLILKNPGKSLSYEANLTLNDIDLYMKNEYGISYNISKSGDINDISSIDIDRIEF